VDDGNQTGAIPTNQLSAQQAKDDPLAYVYLPYENQGTIFASGVDFALQFKDKISGWGSYGVNFEGTLTTRHGYQYAGASSVSDLGVYGDFGVTPRWRHALTFTTTVGNWNGSLTQNFTSSYQDYNGTETISASYPATRTVSANQVWDGQLGYRGVKNLELIGGIKNLFDKAPPLSRNELFFQTGYDSQYASPLGRTYYLRLKYKFL
ncbi:MAG: TonB-dependent receptor, partial [Paucibacter sp.]|nr:TonB-dependent receptor [Roseateles sp.]